MFDLAVKVKDQMGNVAKAADKANFRNLGHAAASLAKDARESIEQSEGPAPAGSPPHTHKKRLLKRALRYDVTDNSAVIGPVASLVGQSGAAQEFGGNYKGEEYPARPFMGPALERATPRFAGEWSGSIGE